MSETFIKVMRYEIVCPVGCTWDDLGKTLRDVQYAVWKTYNRTVQMAWDYQQFSFGYRERFGEKLRFEALGTGRKSQTTDIYAEMTKQFPDVGTTIIDSAIQNATKRFKALTPEILKGNASVPSYKRDVPIPIRAQAIRLRKEGNDRIIRLSLLSRESDRQSYVDVKVRTKGSAASIFNRLVSGEYTLGGSEVFRVKSKWYVNLTYKFTKDVREVSRNNTLGVDLGIVNAAALALHNGEERFFIKGGEIQAFRNRVEARRKSLLCQGKYCGEGRRGHGRKTRIKPIESLSDRIANFRKTTNHKYAKSIVEFAIKNGCSTIQLEDLSGINERETFLKNWSYYDLQTKIEQKASEHGIVVRKINSRHTSQRCSCCGYIAKGNRPSQAIFECLACGYKANADYNAAKNIAHPRIEQLIDEELRRQAQEIRLA